MQITPPATIGLIGLGLMGSVLGKRLRRAGFEVLGFDLVAERRVALEATGCRVADGNSEVFRSCKCVVLSLPDSGITRAVLAEFTRDSACKVVIDTTTGLPSDAEVFAAELAIRGVQFLDATVSASSAQLEEGQEVTVMVGGDQVALTQCRQVFDSFATQTFFVGASGNGSRMKLISNLILGLNRAALAEGIYLAGLLGIEADVLKEVLPKTKARSAMMDSKLTKMLEEDFTPQARLSQHLKDVRLMLDQATANGGLLPLSEVHEKLLGSAEARGFGDSDNCAVSKAYTNQQDETHAVD